jgi:hypothetical protein
MTSIPLGVIVPTKLGSHDGSSVNATVFFGGVGDVISFAEEKYLEWNFNLQYNNNPR